MRVVHKQIVYGLAPYLVAVLMVFACMHSSRAADGVKVDKQPVDAIVKTDDNAESAASSEDERAVAPVQAGGNGPAVNRVGFYPIWDNTGFIIPHQHLYLGTDQIQFGLVNWVQIGVMSIQMIMRTPNIQFKFHLATIAEKIHMALGVGLIGVLPGAEDKFFSQSFTSRLAVDQDTLYVLPVQIATTFSLANWLLVHQTLSLVTTFGQTRLKSQVVAGGFWTAEFPMWKYHSLFLHIGEIGFWQHDTFTVGASYRFAYKWFQARLGYFYRKSPEGMQRHPLLSVAIYF